MKRKWTVETATAYVAKVGNFGMKGLTYWSAMDFLKNHTEKKD